MLFNVWVTNACNFRCNYCYVPEYKHNIDINLADSILRFIKYTVPATEKEIIVNFHGGEPLLNFDVVKYMIDTLDLIYGSSILYGMTTNGSLLTDDIIQFMAKKFLYNLSISLDGAREINDSNRKFQNSEGTYDKVIEYFLTLNKIRPDVRVRMTYNPDTINYLYDSINHIVNLGFSNIVAVADYENKKWTEQDVDILQEELEKIYSTYIHNSKVEINFISDLITRKKGRCNGGNSSFNIDMDGSLYPCTWSVGRIDFKIGDIYKGIDIEEVKKLHEHSVVNNIDCEGCALIECCSGNRCKSINKIITGDFYKTPIFKCQYNNIIYLLQKKYGLA